jgi:hypothetical protein
MLLIGYTHALCILVEKQVLSFQVLYSMDAPELSTFMIYLYTSMQSSDLLLFDLLFCGLSHCIFPYRPRDEDFQIWESRGWMTIHNRFRFHRTLIFELQLVLEVDSVSVQFASFDGLIGSCIFLALGGI